MTYTLDQPLVFFYPLVYAWIRGFVLYTCFRQTCIYPIKYTIPTYSFSPRLGASVTGWLDEVSSSNTIPFDLSSCFSHFRIIKQHRSSNAPEVAANLPLILNKVINLFYNRYNNDKFYERKAFLTLFHYLSSFLFFGAVTSISWCIILFHNTSR